MTVTWFYRGRGICDDCDGGGGFTGLKLFISTKYCRFVCGDCAEKATGVRPVTPPPQEGINDAGK